MSLYIVTYTHKHGTDTWPVSCDRLPHIQEIVDGCGIDYEPEHDEDIEINGPYEGWSFASTPAALTNPFRTADLSPKPGQ